MEFWFGIGIEEGTMSFGHEKLDVYQFHLSRYNLPEILYFPVNGDNDSDSDSNTVSNSYEKVKKQVLVVIKKIFILY